MAQLKILGVNKTEEGDEEYLHIDVLEDGVNLGEYAVYDRTFDGTKISDINVHLFRFQNKIANKGDIITLLSGNGEPNYKKGSRGNNLGFFHVFYTGTDQQHWNKTGDTITLIRYKNLESIKLPDIS